MGHCALCGAGTGIFLLLSDSEVLVIHADKAVLYPSPYLDSHGECDRGLNRGYPLFLNQPRYEALEVIWRNHELGKTAFMLEDQGTDEDMMAPHRRNF